MDVRRENVPCQVEPALDQLLRPLERPILMLDADDMIVAGRVQRRHEPVPTDLTQPRQPGNLPAETAAEDAVLVQHLPVDLQILGVDVEYPILELGDRPHLVDELPDQVRGVVVETKILVWDD